MKTLLKVLSIVLALAASNGFAQTAPASDEYLFVNNLGVTVTDILIPEVPGEAPTPLGFCLACSPGLLELFDPNGALSDYVVFGLPNADGFHQMTFFSDQEGTPLVAPDLTVNLALTETGALQDITRLFPLTAQNGGHIFIRSDVEVPEPAMLALLGAGILALAFVRGRAR